MNQKNIGIILIISGIVLIGFLFIIQHNEDIYIKEIMKSQGSCFLDDGTCLHADRPIYHYIIGGVIAALMVFFGIYLTFIDKTYETLMKHQQKITQALDEVKKSEKYKDEFGAFLTGFTEDEQKLLKAIKEQDGILQSTLRYRVGMSKASVSLMLKSFEERGFISRAVKGKSNQVFLKKKF